MDKMDLATPTEKKRKKGRKKERKEGRKEDRGKRDSSELDLLIPH
jgi:hypothetical protein